MQTQTRTPHRAAKVKAPFYPYRLISSDSVSASSAVAEVPVTTYRETTSAKLVEDLECDRSLKQK